MYMFDIFDIIILNFQIKRKSMHYGNNTYYIICIRMKYISKCIPNVLTSIILENILLIIKSF